MLLLVGAGASMRVDYPSFKGYAQQLVEQFDVDVSHVPEDDPSAIAGAIKASLTEAGRLDEFHAHLERTFGPDARTQRYDAVHRILVSARFRGIATTNYDSVLEDAASADGDRCEDLDLCLPRSFAVFDFLRSTSGGRRRRSVLHLHGWFQNPEHLVVTSDDYAKRYGPYFEETPDGGQVRVELDTMHRKVIWALLVSYPVLFVGFSLDDPALRHLLDVINRDFQRGRELDHFALMGVDDEAQEGRIAQQLAPYGVTPIFYPVTVLPDEREDHSRLEDVLADLCEATAERTTRSRGEAFTERMLGR
ncbi:MAG TPA: SIR2 family protein [Gaiellaceae bacterium]|nr:SIR2 family protein [Gaiellaceae bacterium]